MELKDFGLNKYSKRNLKYFILRVDFQRPKELSKLHNDYPLTSDKIEIKKMLSKYQLVISDLNNTLIGDTKKIIAC